MAWALDGRLLRCWAWFAPNTRILFLETSNPPTNVYPHLPVSPWNSYLLCSALPRPAPSDDSLSCALPVLLVVSIETDRPPLVKTCATMFRSMCYKNKDSLSAAIIVAGYDDVNKGSLYSIPLGGTCVRQPFAIGGT